MVKISIYLSRRVFVMCNICSNSSARMFRLLTIMKYVVLIAGIYCFLGFILSASCEEIRTCIPRPTSTIESCHSFSITCPKDTYIGFHHLMYHWSDCLSRFNCNTRDKCCDTTKSDCQTEFSMLDTYRTYIKCSGKEHCIETSLDVSPLRPEAVECFDQNEANKDKTMVPLFMSMTYDCIPCKFKQGYFSQKQKLAKGSLGMLIQVIIRSMILMYQAATG